MSLAATSQTASFDQSGVYKLDLSEVLASLLLDDIGFLSYIGISSDAATQTKHEWVEDALNPTVIIQNGGNSSLSGAADVVMTLSAGHAARITAGTLLKDKLSGKTEVMQVTAVLGISATVTRGFGGTSGQVHAKSATYDIIANARPQGMTGPKDESMTRVKAYNYTQIFSKGVKLTGTATAIDHAGISNEDDYQIDKRFRELKRELDRTVIMGVRNGQPSDSAYGAMGGIIEWVGFIGAGNVSGTAETLTPSVLNTMAKQVWDDGGMPDFVLVGGTQKQKISLFDEEYRRSTLDTRRAGYTVEEFVTDLGVNLRVIIDRWVPTDVVIVGEKSKIKVMPLTGRSFFLEKLGTTGDSNDWQIVGEYTMEVRNAAEAFSYHFNLKQ